MKYYKEEVALVERVGGSPGTVEAHRFGLFFRVSRDPVTEEAEAEQVGGSGPKWPTLNFL